MGDARRVARILRQGGTGLHGNFCLSQRIGRTSLGSGLPYAPKG